MKVAIAEFAYISPYGIHRLKIDLLATASGFLVGRRKLPNSKFSLSENDVLQKLSKIFEALLPLFQGNMPYFLSIVVDEYLDL